MIDYMFHSQFTMVTNYFGPRDNTVEDTECSIQADLTEDADVRGEAMRVMRGEADGDVIRLENLKKIYRAPEGVPKVAVRSLSFGVKVGDCFGFLGVNGAGKTSTLNMLTGVTMPSSGTAYVEGHDIVKEQRQVRRLMGYCPQHDALLDRLTVQDHLQLFGQLKGIPFA